MKIEEQAKILKQKEIAICPTDTTWGIIGILNNKNREEINFIKKAPLDKKMQVTFYNKKQAYKYLSIISKMKLFIFNMKFKTLILKTNKKYVDSVGNSLGIRITTDKNLSRIIENVGPVYSTSVNIHGEPNLKTYDEIKKTFDLPILGNKLFISSQSSKIYDWYSIIIKRIR